MEGIRLGQHLWSIKHPPSCPGETQNPTLSFQLSDGHFGTADAPIMIHINGFHIHFSFLRAAPIRWGYAQALLSSEISRAESLFFPPLV